MFLIDPKKITSRIAELSATIRNSTQTRMNQRITQLQHRLHQGLLRHK
jgi:hypothetical protein